MELRDIFYDLINEYGMIAVEEQLRVVKRDVLNNYIAVLRTYGYSVIKNEDVLECNVVSEPVPVIVQEQVQEKVHTPVIVEEKIQEQVHIPVIVEEKIQEHIQEKIQEQIQINEPTKDKKKRVYKINKVSSVLPAAPTLEEVSSVPVVSSVTQPINESQFDGDYNKIQRQKEKEKREELKRAGVDMKTVLTVENVKKWLEDGNSYAWIAREKVGCKQELISKFAKLNGITTSVSK